MSALGQDIRFALRTLRKNRGFAVAAILTIALGIGANSAMFTVIRAVLLKPLAYPDADRVVQISGGATIAHFQEMKAAQQSYASMGASFCCPSMASLSGPQGPVALKQAPVSGNFLEILGVEPILGRRFFPEEDLPGGPKVAMISAALWQGRFQGDPNIIGKTATIEAAVHTIVGVLPSGFDFPAPGVDVWVPRPEEHLNATSPMLQPFGRLKPGVSLAQASAELAALNQQYRRAHATMLDAKQPTAPERVVPMKEVLVTNVRATLWILAGVVGLLLLIACANVAGLLLARATSRSREVAVRSALGAGQWRLIQQLLVECVILALLGGALGLLLAQWGLRGIVGMPWFIVPRADEIHLDGIVLAVTVTLSLATGVLFGLIPALKAARPDLMTVLRATGEAANSSARRRFGLRLSARGGLVIAQVALSMILLTGAALLIESIVRLRNVDPGFDTSNVLTMRIAIPYVRYDTEAKMVAFYDDLVSRVEALPGVRSAALAFVPPFTPYAMTPVQRLDQGAIPLNQRLLAMFQNVTADYFQTLGIGLRRGRMFTEHDDKSAPLSVVLNEALARKLWPAYPNSPDPVGERVWIGAKNDPVEIVGIVADTHQWLAVDATPAMYRPLAQMPNAGAFLVRTDGDPLRATKAIRSQIAAIDTNQAVSSIQSLQQLKDAEVGHNNLILALLTGFAAIAMLLAVTGIYGIIAYSVAQRTQEVGIRRALGAQYVDIVRLVLGQGLALTLTGIALGICGALALTRFLTSLLFQTSPTNPLTLACVAGTFLIVGLTAAYLPARRAARIDPMQALRQG